MSDLLVGWLSVVFPFFALFAFFVEVGLTYIFSSLQLPYRQGGQVS